MADIKRKIARAVAVLSVALGAGHLVQNMSKSPQTARVARTQVLPEPKAIQTVAATDILPAAAPQPKPALIEPIAAAPTPPAVKAMPKPIILAATGATEPMMDQPIPKVAPTLVLPVAPVAKAQQTELIGPAPQIAEACSVKLDLMADPNAMIGLTLQAACHPNERVVIKHAGLAISAMTTANGALFTGIPAFEISSTIEVVFADGQIANGTIAMPDIAQLRRFGVQWQAEDAFQVHAFENGSGYGGAGHVSGIDPHLPIAGQQTTGGFVTLLGDSTVKNPLLAEIYTFPADPAAKAEVVVESAVTEATCGRELLGETLNAIAGEVYVTDLTLAMPDCSAVGDYMVLKNLVLDLNIAAAE